MYELEFYTELHVVTSAFQVWCDILPQWTSAECYPSKCKTYNFEGVPSTAKGSVISTTREYRLWSKTEKSLY